MQEDALEEQRKTLRKRKRILGKRIEESEKRTREKCEAKKRAKQKKQRRERARSILR